MINNLNDGGEIMGRGKSKVAANGNNRAGRKSNSTDELTRRILRDAQKAATKAYTRYLSSNSSNSYNPSNGNMSLDDIIAKIAPGSRVVGVYGTKESATYDNNTTNKKKPKRRSK